MKRHRSSTDDVIPKRLAAAEGVTSHIDDWNPEIMVLLDSALLALLFVTSFQFFAYCASVLDSRRLYYQLYLALLKPTEVDVLILAMPT